MAFDIKSAQLVAEAPAKSGFDINTAQRVEPLPEKSVGKQVGESIAPTARSLWKSAKDVIVGTIETPLAMANNAISSSMATVAGPVVNALGGDGMAARKAIQDTFTYTPRSESGRASVKAMGDVGAATIGRAGNFAADVVEGAGADPLTVETTRDVANIIAGGAAAKALPKVISKSADAGKATARAAGKAVDMGKRTADVIGEIYTPERQALVAGGHLAAGDLIGASVQGTMAAGRKAYAARKAPATVSEAIAPKYAGITTKADAALIRDIVAERRAAAAARNEAAGRVYRSTN